MSYKSEFSIFIQKSTLKTRTHRPPALGAGGQNFAKSFLKTRAHKTTAYKTSAGQNALRCFCYANVCLTPIQKRIIQNCQCYT